mgnify:CR=1 FL=1
MENAKVTSEVYRYNVGEIEVVVMSDGFRKTPLDKYLKNATVEQLAQALDAAGLPTDHLRNTYSPVMLRTGGKGAGGKGGPNRTEKGRVIPSGL